MSGRILPGQAALDPLLTKVARRFPSGADSVSPDPQHYKTSLKKAFRGPKSQAMATYVPEVARLTCDTGSNSRLRMNERGMTGDEHNRGQGPNPTGSRRIFASHIRDPCGCHESGIPSREASSPRDLTNGSDIHRDCPRVLFEMCP